MKIQPKVLLAWTLVLLMAQQQAQCSKKIKLEILKILQRGRETYDKLVVSVRDGANLGLEQCKEQFQFNKWNCTIGLPRQQASKLPVILTTNIPHATRETAFTNSISAAGVTYALTRDCRMGNFKDCSCVHNRNKKSAKDKRTWWGGCSENIKFGEVMAKHFLEALEKGDVERKVLSSHNNEVGRKAVRLTLKKQCRCHGITGSCSALTCWRRLAPFKEIGKYLKEKYKNARRVRFTKNKLKIKTDKGYKPVLRKDQNLFFTESSPDYCQRNLTVGAAGVLGRVCQGSKKQLEQCRKVCHSCGLKPILFKEVQQVNCHCKFEWCCKVRCDSCKRTVSKIKCIPANNVSTPKINGDLK